jgi:ubiquinone/menaquinone biosynthesis C-methylase UbiE
MGFYSLIGTQLGKPTGWVGKFVAFMITRRNASLHDWTVQVMDIQPDHHILEVGFGSGSTIERMEKLASEGMVYGIDYSDTMVDLAAKRNRRAIAEGRVQLAHGDVAELPYEADTFDRICAIHALYFWPDPVAVLKQLRHVMKPGGMLAISIEPRDVLSKSQFTQEGAFTLYAGEEVRDLFEQAGFKSATVRKQPGFERLCITGVK